MNRGIMSFGRTGFAIAVIVCAGSSLAIEPVKGPRLDPVPVQSQETLSAQQKHNGRVPIVGSVELKPREERPAPKASAATQELGKSDKAPSAFVRQSDSQAAMALHEVELQNQMASTAPFRKIIWAVVVVAFGLGLAFLVKFFADKSMPQVPSKTKVNW